MITNREEVIDKAFRVFLKMNGAPDKPCGGLCRC